MKRCWASVTLVRAMEASRQPLTVDALAFKILVDGEEVGDLAEHVGIDLGVVPDVLVAGVAHADAEDLLVAEALVGHLEQADGADFHDAAGEGRAIDEDEHVEGITVVAEGGGDEAIVAGIVDGRVEVAVEAEDVEGLVVLVLVDSVAGDLDDDVDDLRAFGADGKFEVVRHGLVFSLCASKSWWKRLSDGRC